MIILRGMKSTSLITRGYGALRTGYHEVHTFIMSIARTLVYKVGK